MSGVSDRSSVGPVVRRSGSAAAVPLVVAVALFAHAARAAPPAGATRPGPPAASGSARYPSGRLAGNAGRYYRLVWGIDAMTVRLVESGELVRFTWRVLDPQRAALLNDKRIEPALRDPQAGVSLVVPVLDKIGPLRQGFAPEAGKSYWMVFSNKGRLVKRGDRVSIVVGTFRADGLVVD